MRLVCEIGMQLQMRQCDCNGAAVCTFCAVVIVVCFVRYALSVVWSFVFTSRVVFDCVFGLLYVSGFIV